MSRYIIKLKLKLLFKHSKLISIITKSLKYEFKKIKKAVTHYIPFGIWELLSGKVVLMYLFYCALPHDRYVYIQENKIVEASAGDDTSFTLCQRYVEYVDESQTSHWLTLEALGHRLNFHYTPFLLCLHEKELRGLLFVKINISEFPSSRELDFHEKLDTGYISPPFLVRYINSTVGNGLYCSEDCSSGLFIGEYVGLLSSSSSSSYSLLYPTMTDGYDINASIYGNIIRFVNHSESPNARFQCVAHDELVHIVCVSTTLYIKPYPFS